LPQNSLGRITKGKDSNREPGGDLSVNQPENLGVKRIGAQWVKNLHASRAGIQHGPRARGEKRCDAEDARGRRAQLRKTSGRGKEKKVMCPAVEKG